MDRLAGHDHVRVDLGGPHACRQRAGQVAGRRGAARQVDLVPVAEGMRILPEDTREFARQIQALPEDNQRMLLPRALLNALRRFSTTRNIQDVSSSTRDIFESEAERLESELSSQAIGSLYSELGPSRDLAFSSTENRREGFPDDIPDPLHHQR